MLIQSGADTIHIKGAMDRILGSHERCPDSLLRMNISLLIEFAGPA